MLHAKNITVGYGESEDRLLLACTDGTQLQSLWLTRRMTARLLKSAAELLEKSSMTATRAPADLRGDVIAFEHQSAMSQPEAIRPGGPQAPPAGLIDLGAVVVHKLQIDIAPTQFRVIFHTQTTPIVAVMLGRPDFHRVLAIIDQYATRADWGLPRERDWLGPGPTPATGPGSGNKLAS